MQLYPLKHVTIVAEAILTYISHNLFENYGCIAWVTDVSVVRGSHYVMQK